MEESHKYVLRRNRTHLVRELQPSELYDSLLEKRVFTADMIDEIKSHGTRRDQARQLVQDLETRGSRAFPLFLQCLQDAGRHSLVEILQNEAPTVQLHPATPTQSPAVQPLPLSPRVDVDKKRKDDFLPVSPAPRPAPSLSPPPERETVTPRAPARPRRDSIQSYKMDSTPRGHCLIINNVEFDPDSDLSSRKGSNVDCEKLERRFRALDFMVEVKTNLKQRQIKHQLSALSKKDHSEYDCCVVIILSHGTEVSHNRFPGAVYGVDGQHVAVQLVTNYLNGRHCPTLQSKPKLFFIQACGGGERDTGYEVSPDDVSPSPGGGGGADDQTDAIPTSSSSDSLSTSDEPDARATLPTPCDILVSYSTFPGYVSWRDTESGSWYVETLDRILEENAATHDLVTMLMMVNHEVSQNSAKGLYKQMPGSFNFLRKLLYFQPPRA